MTKSPNAIAETMGKEAQDNGWCTVFTKTIAGEPCVRGNNRTGLSR